MIEHDGMLINPRNIEYCRLVKKSGYGYPVDHIHIFFIDGTDCELNHGEELWNKLKEKD